MKLLSSAVFLLVLGSALSYKSYAGYQVIKTAPLTVDVMKDIKNLEKRFDFWTTPRVGRSALIMTSPKDNSILRAALNKLNLRPVTHISDVGPTVLRERAEHLALKKKFPAQGRVAVYDRFMEFDEIVDHIRSVNADNPSITEIVNIATSTEGRPLEALKISTGPGKKAIWVDCAIHAREWIAPPTCLKIIDEVLADPALQDLIDWIILPVANPDGYTYSFSDDRFWRKTRRANPGTSCVGTDPNRNFDFLWNSDNNDNYCALTYPGDRAFSEPECAGIGNFVTAGGNSGYIVLYLAIHSYGQLLIYPWGHTNEPAPNQPELQAAGDAAAAAIEAIGGTVYDVGASGESLYYTYGASDDYAYGVGLVPYSYTFELPGGGSQGFDIPASRIQEVVDETWPGIRVLAERVAAVYAK